MIHFISAQWDRIRARLGNPIQSHTTEPHARRPITRVPLNAQEVAERAIVYQLLRTDHNQQWGRAELESEILAIEPLTISDAIETLHQEGVIDLSNETIQPSRCTQHLEMLGLVSL